MDCCARALIGYGVVLQEQCRTVFEDESMSNGLLDDLEYLPVTTAIPEH